MKQYLNLINEIINKGEVRKDRTSTGTVSIFGHQMKFDLEDGFPLVTTKQVHFKSVIGELLWFLRGDTNIKYLHDNGITIWDEWADKDGNLGPVYGKQWRSWEPGNIDQIKNVIQGIKDNPCSRRHIVSAWNVSDIPDMALPPCHSFFQFYVSNDRKLSLQLYQRSADVFLGMPFNIASYATLLIIVSRLTSLVPGTFIYTTGDTHIYLNHMEQVKTQLSRSPLKLPVLSINKDISTVSDLDKLEIKDFVLEGYNPHPAIKGKVSV